jgi:hypothetical protein
MTRRHKGIAAMAIDQADLQQLIERTALGSEMTAEVSAVSMTDPEFLQEGVVVQPALIEIATRIRRALTVEGLEVLSSVGQDLCQAALETETPVSSATVWTDSKNGFCTAALTKRRWSSQENKRAGNNNAWSRGKMLGAPGRE